jgi:hypothetical protein
VAGARTRRPSEFAPIRRRCCLPARGTLRGFHAGDQGSASPHARPDRACWPNGPTAGHRHSKRWRGGCRDSIGCAPQKCRPAGLHRLPSSAWRQPCSAYGAPTSPKSSTRGAVRAARMSLARALPVSIDIEVQPSRFVQILREARVHRVPVHCADARRCSVQPTREGSSGDAPRTAESSSPGTHAGSCRSLRSQIAFALGLENGERSTARPNARIESSRCLAKMLSRSWIRYL